MTKNNSFSFHFNKTLVCIAILYFSGSFAQDLKKEIHVPFPENITIDESIRRDAQKAKQNNPVREQVKQNLTIPFPKDPLDKKEPEIELKQVEVTTNAKEAVKSTNSELPLDKIIVLPETEISKTTNEPAKTTNAKDAPVKETIVPKTVEVVTEKVDAKSIVETNKTPEKEKVNPTVEVGKALVESGKQKVAPKPKTAESSVLPKSKLDLREYGAKEKPTKSFDKTTPAKDTTSKKEDVVANIPVTKLPNINKAPDKKTKEKKKADESSAPYERSKYYLNRDDKASAISELNTSSSGDGEKTNLAKMDQIRLLAQERKKNEAKSVIDGISDLDFKFKGLYELAVGLENSAKGEKKLKEEAIPFHLTIITEAPESNPIVAKSLWALSHLLYTIGDHTPALDHLSDIILKHSKSEYIDDAIYLSGRIYEESTSIRNLNRARKYYQLFLENETKPFFKNSIYLPFVKKRLELLDN